MKNATLSAKTITTNGMTKEERKVIVASSFGALLEWYDFYIYAALAGYFSSLFFPPGNATAAFLASLATFGAGFLVRPMGALFFGRMGDRLGRKRTFMVTIILMGVATVGIGLLPSYENIGIVATVSLVILRLLQGFALGGEVGGAVTYVAEHSPTSRRGLYTGCLQITAGAGLLLALAAVYSVKELVNEESFRAWGWRIPFIVSLVLLSISVFVRGKLEESPTFLRMKAAGHISKAPIRESFLVWKNLRFVLILFWIAAALGAIFGTGHFYSMFFLNQTLKLPLETVHLVLAAVLVVATPLYLFFGWLSDRLGRKPIIIMACLLAAVTIGPIFKGLTHYGNPVLEKFLETPISVEADGCKFRVFSAPVSACDKAHSYLTDKGVGFTSLPAKTPDHVVISIGEAVLTDPTPEQLSEALIKAGWPLTAEPKDINMGMLFVLMLLPVVYLTMIYGTIAAFMVELFPARIRYTSLSLPFHLGAGWIGGMLSFIVSTLNVAYGDPYFGLWFPISVAGLGLLVTLIFAPETRGRSLED